MVGSLVGALRVEPLAVAAVVNIMVTTITDAVVSRVGFTARSIEKRSDASSFKTDRC